MAKTKCPNDECPYKTSHAGLPYTSENPTVKKCPNCKTALVEVVETFESFAAEVKTALAKNYPASFQKKVIDFLSMVGGHEQRFRSDFIDCMKRPIDKALIVSHANRKATQTTNCSDNAIGAALGGDLPGDAPKGSKYDFEAAYLMSTTEFTYLQLVEDQAEIFMGKLTDLKPKLEPECRYTIMFRGQKTDKIGHMIYCWTDKQGILWVYDPQKLGMGYLSANGAFEFWQRSGAQETELYPRCSIDLKKNKMSAFEDKPA